MTALLRPLLFLFLATAALAADPMRVMSFNVRYAHAQDGADAWPKRTELFFATIAAFGPDLIGFQEVVAVQHDAIAARLPGYGLSGVARDDGKRKGEWSCIGYRKSRYTLVAEGNFWLSETPEVVGSKSWDAALTRICSWVRLRETASGKEFVYANTHFDHVGKIARAEASRVISERVSVIAAGVPALLTGDLNINEDNPAYSVFVKPTVPGAIRWIDAFREVHPQRGPDEVSFHAFKGGTKGSRIDFIFHTDHWIATEAAIDRTSKDGHYPSDHYPVTAVVRMK
ncbi:MAG: endonuclease/exonuclease/phosphatase family protein [Verrucomicrobia bacterium]|nr:endonuclease/exonuclease/phosphatase family protein [Verrucomicrobiota bacterium]